MSGALASPLSHRILVYAPTGRDAELAVEMLRRAGVRAQSVSSAHALCQEILEGAAAVLVAEEALSPATLGQVSWLLNQQPPWSDLPFIIFAAPTDDLSSNARLQAMLGVLGNVTVLERPTRVATLVTAARAALRARSRQYTARETLVALEARETELKRADQRKDEFLAMLAHELRNPMAAISMALSMIDRDSGDPARLIRYRETAERQVTNLVRLVDDLLDVSRITRGVVELRRTSLDLADLVRGAVTAARPSVEALGHQLSLTLQPGNYQVMADATRLEQVVANLLSNAAKYTDPGGRIEVELRRGPSIEGERSSALIIVRDNGRGIPPQRLRQVFDLFVQIDPSIDRGTGGLGLGLTLVKRLVEMHGGEVTAASEGPGRGSVFTIRIPLDPQAQVHAAADHEALARGQAESPRSRRILLVEDSEDIREMMKELLEFLGHQVTVASTGPEGVTKLLEQRPELAFVDVGLPGLSGYDVARRVRAAPEGKNLFLIALTGYGGAEARSEAQAAGFDLHLTKPIAMNELPGIIDSAP